MTATLDKLVSMLETMGSNVTFHREDNGVACPCRSPEGFRMPKWHRDHPPGTPNLALAGPPWNGINPPVCNEQGFQAVVTEFIVKASVQPAVYGYRRTDRRAEELLGEVMTDDKLGIFPCTWNGNPVSFDNWSDDGEDFLLYDGKRYICVAADKVPDIDGDPNHHWETGLRLVKNARPV